MDLKRTKRLKSSTDVLTLEEHITARRKELVRSRKEAPHLLEQAEEMERRAEEMTERYLLRERADILRKASSLRREAEERESMRREHDFERKVVQYLTAYSVQKRNTFSSSELTKRNSSICDDSETLPSSIAPKQASDLGDAHTDRERRVCITDEFLTEMDDAPAKVVMAVRDVCPTCNEKLLLSSTKCVLCCSKCGYTMAYFDTTSTSTSFDEVVEYSQYSYKRVNHYMMHLSLVQGKETYRVADSVLQDVMRDIYHRAGVRSGADITHKIVHQSLRRLKHRKSYDHVVQITARLSGRPPPQVGKDVENQLRNMFLQMQPAFHRHAPKNRTNFLSYSYVLYRCFQILGHTYMLPSIILLKGKDKLEANDLIFRDMCTTLGWPLFDLPPTAYGED